MGVAKALGEAHEFLQVLRVGGEVFFVTPVVNRLQSVFLKDESSGNEIADYPFAVTVLPVPFLLTGRALLHATGPTHLALDNVPRHSCSPESLDHSILLHLPKILFSPTQPHIHPRSLPT